MVKISLDPGAELAALHDLQAELTEAVLGAGRARTVEVELASVDRPRHLVLQLLASVAATEPAPGRKVSFGPRAAAELARVEREERA